MYICQNIKEVNFVIVMIMGVRDAENDQGCIDNVLGKPDPFGDGRKVKVVKNWGADGHCEEVWKYIWQNIKEGNSMIVINGRARDAGNDQGCIDQVLGKPNPFGDGREVKL